MKTKILSILSIGLFIFAFSAFAHNPDGSAFTVNNWGSLTPASQTSQSTDAQNTTENQQAGTQNQPLKSILRKGETPASGRNVIINKKPEVITVESFKNAKGYYNEPCDKNSYIDSDNVVIAEKEVIAESGCFSRMFDLCYALCVNDRAYRENNNKQDKRDPSSKDDDISGYQHSHYADNAVNIKRTMKQFLKVNKSSRKQQSNKNVQFDEVEEGIKAKTINLFGLQQEEESKNNDATEAQQKNAESEQLIQEVSKSPVSTPEIKLPSGDPNYEKAANSTFEEIQAGNAKEEGPNLEIHDGDHLSLPQGSTSTTANSDLSTYDYLAQFSQLSISSDSDGNLTANLAASDGNVYGVNPANSSDPKIPCLVPHMIHLGEIGLQGIEPSVTYFGNDPNNDNPMFFLSYISKNDQSTSKGNLYAVILELNHNKLVQETTPFNYAQGGRPYDNNFHHLRTHDSCFIGAYDNKLYFVDVFDNQFNLNADNDGTATAALICYDPTTTVLTLTATQTLHSSMFGPSVTCDAVINNGTATFSIAYDNSENVEAEDLYLSIDDYSVNLASSTISFTKNTTDGDISPVCNASSDANAPSSPTISYIGTDKNGNKMFDLEFLEVQAVSPNGLTDYVEDADCYDMTVTENLNPNVWQSTLKEIATGFAKQYSSSDISSFPATFSFPDFSSTGEFIPTSLGVENIRFYAVKNCSSSDLGIGPNNILSGPSQYMEGKEYSIFINDANTGLIVFPVGEANTISPRFLTKNGIFEIQPNGQQLVSFIASNTSPSDISYTDINGKTGTLANFTSQSFQNLDSYSVLMPVGTYLTNIGNPATTQLKTANAIFTLTGNNSETVEFEVNYNCNINYPIIVSTGTGNPKLSDIIDSSSPTYYQPGQNYTVNMDIQKSGFINALCGDMFQYPAPNNSYYMPIEFESEKPQSNSTILPYYDNGSTAPAAQGGNSTTSSPVATSSQPQLIVLGSTTYNISTNGITTYDTNGSTTTIVPAPASGTIVASAIDNTLAVGNTTSGNISIMNPSNNVLYNAGTSDKDIASISSDNWNGTKITYSDNTIDEIHMAGFDSNGTLYYSNSSGIYSTLENGTPKQLLANTSIVNCALGVNNSIIYIDSTNNVYSLSANGTSTKLFTISTADAANLIPQSLTVSDSGIVFLATSTGQLYIENPALNPSNYYVMDIYTGTAYNYENIAVISTLGNTAILGFTDGTVQGIDIEFSGKNVYASDGANLYLLNDDVVPTLLKAGTNFMIANNNDGSITAIDSSGNLYTYTGSTLISSGIITSTSTPTAMAVYDGVKDAAPGNDGVIGYADGSVQYFFYNGKSLETLPLYAPCTMTSSDNSGSSGTSSDVVPNSVINVGLLANYPGGFKLTWMDNSFVIFSQIVPLNSEYAYCVRAVPQNGASNEYNLFLAFKDSSSLEQLNKNLAQNIFITSDSKYVSIDSIIYTLSTDPVMLNPVKGISDNSGISAITDSSDENTIYYSDFNGNVYSCPSTGGTPTQLTPTTSNVPSAVNCPVSMAVSGNVLTATLLDNSTCSYTI